MKLLTSTLCLGLWLFAIPGFSQNNDPGRISGSFQTDVQYLFEDSVIGANAVDERVLSNSFLQLTYNRGNLSAGLRYEAYLNPLLGFDGRYEGQGIAYRFAEYQGDKLDITVGNFYDQFGNGIVFRSYQEWGLGIDNSVDGIRVQFRPKEGLTLKGIIGKQRKFWERTESILRGADVDMSVNDLFPALKESKTRLFLGGSIMSKYQQDDDLILQLPENVSAFGGRFRLIRGGLSVDGEAAYKINDPFQLNKFVYNPGNALYLNASYATKGFGLLFSAKRIDNFDFRSERQVSLQELSLSFLPPISKLHTYRLPTLYPYATQLNGEVGIQGTLLYTIPKSTVLGGKYGTKLQLNYSRIHGLDTTFVEPNFRYETSFIGDPGNLYFQDINLEINRRMTKDLRLIFTYIYLKYNKDIIEFNSVNAGYGIVNTHIQVLETQYKLSRRVSLRTELQHMYTKQDLGSWALALAEISISPNWYFTVFDEWNYANPNPELRVHYYNGQVAYAFESSRISFGYSRQRRGLLCVGGICREVPAANGFSLSISSSF
ncbi:MAG: DUF6029 family protein [Bacteroidia bacterium]|nr:DUF6029 family protein [Bacteroidia bacterium]